MPICYVIFLVICSCKAHNYFNGDKVFNRQKLESVLQKYMKPIKKLSEQFPNREIELQFEIDGNKGQIVASPKTKYVRVPAALIPQLNPVSDVSTPNVMALTPSRLTTNSVAGMTTIKDINYKVGNSFINNNNFGAADPDQTLISLGELKKILEEYDKEVKRDGEDRHPSLKKDLCLALGMKYGLKCDDSATENTGDLRSVTSAKSGNFHKILQILNEGEVVERNTFSGNSKENLYWFKIKFPK